MYYCIGHIWRIAPYLLVLPSFPATAGWYLIGTHQQRYPMGGWPWEPLVLPYPWSPGSPALEAVAMIWAPWASGPSSRHLLFCWGNWAVIMVRRGGCCSTRGAGRACLEPWEPNATPISALCSMLMANGQLQHPCLVKGKVTKDADLLQRKVWVTTRKQSAKMLADHDVEEGVSNTNYRSGFSWNNRL